VPLFPDVSLVGGARGGVWFGGGRRCRGSGGGGGGGKPPGGIRGGGGGGGGGEGGMKEETSEFKKETSDDIWDCMRPNLPGLKGRDQLSTRGGMGGVREKLPKSK